MANISKLTSDQISEMRRLFEEGASQKSLAERYHVSITTVANKLKTLRPSIDPVETPVIRPCTPEELKQAWIPQEEVKKKEPPKRRIVGINI